MGYRQVTDFHLVNLAIRADLRCATFDARLVRSARAAGRRYVAIILRGRRSRRLSHLREVRHACTTCEDDGMSPTPLTLLSPADCGRRRELGSMKASPSVRYLHGGAVRDRVRRSRAVPALEYVRAAAEGGMVGALADWFAVTALFRHPLGIPIPHTAIIAPQGRDPDAPSESSSNRSFLEGSVVREARLRRDVAARAEWLRTPVHADRVAAEASTMAPASSGRSSDDEVQEAHRQPSPWHLIEPDWGPALLGGG